MANEQDNIIESQNDEIELDLDESTEETEGKTEETKEEKPKLTEEELLERLEGRAARLRKKLGKTDSPKKEEVKAPSKPGELDYGQLAYLTAKGIESDDEVSLAETIVKETGKSLKDVVSSKYFQSELKELREAKATTEAIPKSSKRSAQSPRDSVEYWLNKPYEEVPKEMRLKVLNARIAKESDGNKFAPDSIVA